MLTSAHRFIDLITALHGLQVLTPAQCADVSAALQAGFPTSEPAAFKALRTVLHLRQIPTADFADRFNDVLRRFRSQTGGGASPGTVGNQQRAISKRTNKQQTNEGALQGKSVIFPRDDQR